MAFNKMPIITKPNVDINGNPQLIQISNEPHQIFKSKIVLSGIPDKFSRVSITDEDEVIYVEKFDTDTLTGHQFKVNYSSGVIEFPTELEGWSVTVSYYSKGVELVSSERIYTELDDNGDVAELLSDKISEIKLLRQNYDNAVHMDIVRKVRLEYTATQNVTSFVLDANNYNPLIDMVFLYFEGAALIQNKQYVITGTTVTLIDWTLLSGETIDIVVERAVNEILPAGTNGGDLMLGSVGENKLSADVQLKLNKTLVIQDYTFTSISDNTTTFTIASDVFNAETDVLDIYRENLKLTKDINYSITGQIVTLFEGLNIGEFVEYRITKNTGNSVPLMPDGSLIQNRTVAKKKLTQDLQNEITKSTTEITNAKKDKATLKDKIDEIDSRLENIAVNVKTFGAKGDGVTDDTIAIQNAIAYLGNSGYQWGGGVLYFPQGRYRYLANTINMKAQMYLKGEGIDLTVLCPYGNGNGINSVGTNANGWLNAVKVTDLSIDGSNLTGIGMNLKYTGLRSMFENLNIFSCNGKGVYIEGCFDFQMRKIEVRSCTDLGIHVYEQNSFTASGQPFEEISFIEFNQVCALSNNTSNNRAIQWRIDGGDSLKLINCKPSEGLVGLHIDNGANRITISDLYHDGIVGQSSTAIKIAHEWCHHITVNKLSAWECGIGVDCVRGRLNTVNEVEMINGSVTQVASVYVRSTCDGDIKVNLQSDGKLVDDTKDTTYSGNKLTTPIGFACENYFGTIKKYNNPIIWTATLNITMYAGSNYGYLNIPMPRTVNPLYYNAHIETTWEDYIVRMNLKDGSSLDVTFKHLDGRTVTEDLTRAVKILVIGA